MLQPAFRPWVGDGYGKSKRKLLIVGLSHYSAGYEYFEEFTQNVVEQWIYREHSPAFFSKLNNLLGDALDGEKPGNHDRESFRRVAFYNYIQSFCGDGPRKDPDEQQWRDAEAPFKSVLDELEPTHVVLLGARLWDMSPKLELVNIRAELGGESHNIGCYAHKGGYSWVCGFPHPSGGKWGRRANDAKIGIMADFLHLPKVLGPA
jgi:hypothetical protein